MDEEEEARTKEFAEAFAQLHVELGMSMSRYEA